MSVNEGDQLFASAEAFIPSFDSIAGSQNEVYLKIDYYSELYGAFGSAEYLGSDSIVLADGTSVNDLWYTSELFSTVPVGAVEARLALVYSQQMDAAGAVFVDNVQFSIQSIPEPNSAFLIFGVGCFVFCRRHRS